MTISFDKWSRELTRGAGRWHKVPLVPPTDDTTEQLRGRIAAVATTKDFVADESVDEDRNGEQAAHAH